MLVSPVLSQPGLSLRVAAQIGAVECIAEQRHASDPLPVLPDELEHGLYCLGIMFGIVDVCQDDVHLGLHCDLRSTKNGVFLRVSCPFSSTSISITCSMMPSCNIVFFTPVTNLPYFR